MRPNDWLELIQTARFSGSWRVSNQAAVCQPIARFAARLNKTIDVIPDEVLAVLQAHGWPGNIRELQNFLERAVLFSPGSVLRLPLGLKQTVKQNPESAARTLADADREHILETLKPTG